MKYQHKKNGKIVTLLEVREKFKTVMVQPESMDDNDGLPYDITTSTFKRWWKKIEDAVEVEQTDTTEEVTDDDYVDEVMKQKEELGIDVPKLNPDDVEVVEETDVNKYKKEKRKVDKSVSVGVANEVLDFLKTVDGVNIKMWTDTCFNIKSKVVGTVEVHVKRDGTMTLYAKENTFSDFDYEIVKHSLPAIIKNATIRTLKKLYV